VPQIGDANAGHHPGGATIASADVFVEEEHPHDTSG